MNIRAAAILAGLLVIVGVLVQALPTPAQFELEGNATVEGPGDDWANTVPPPPSAGSEALASVFIADGSGQATIFTTGGSKDILDMSQWAWKDDAGGLPDKDNLTNAYAAAYASGDDLTLYFGADRFANDGDAQMGFWFFRQRISLLNGKFVNGAGQPASHSIGDVLILINMTNGGAVARAAAFRWVGGESPLFPIAVELDNAKCGTNTDPDLCVISNPTPVPSPWAYTPKSGTAGTFPTFSFIEGGLNIRVLGAGVGCFSSFLAETRSSQSQNAVLKDFALGEFNTCDIDVTKTCPLVTFDEATGLLTYTSQIVVENKGFGPVFDVTVVDTPSAPALPQTFTLDMLAAGASHTFTHTFTYTPSLTTPNPPSDTATATAAVVDGGPQIIDGGSATATCPRVEFDANLTVTKECVTRVEVQDNRVVVAVDIKGMVCNVPPPPPLGAFPSPIDNIVVTDTPPIDPITIGTLLPGECREYATTYFPTTIIGPGLPSDQRYEDTIAVQGVSRITAEAKANSASANCPLCPPESH